MNLWYTKLNWWYIEGRKAVLLSPFYTASNPPQYMECTVHESASRKRGFSNHNFVQFFQHFLTHIAQPNISIPRYALFFVSLWIPSLVTSSSSTSISSLLASSRSSPYLCQSRKQVTSSNNKAAEKGSRWYLYNTREVLLQYCAYDQILKWFLRGSRQIFLSILGTFWVVSSFTYARHRDSNKSVVLTTRLLTSTSNSWDLLFSLLKALMFFWSSHSTCTLVLWKQSQIHLTFRYQTVYSHINWY